MVRHDADARRGKDGRGRGESPQRLVRRGEQRVGERGGGDGGFPKHKMFRMIRMLIRMTRNRSLLAGGFRRRLRQSPRDHATLGGHPRQRVHRLERPHERVVRRGRRALVRGRGQSRGGVTKGVNRGTRELDARRLRVRTRALRDGDASETAAQYRGHGLLTPAQRGQGRRPRPAVRVAPRDGAHRVARALGVRGLIHGKCEDSRARLARSHRRDARAATHRRVVAVETRHHRPQRGSQHPGVGHRGERLAQPADGPHRELGGSVRHGNSRDQSLHREYRVSHRRARPILTDEPRGGEQHERPPLHRLDRSVNRASAPVVVLPILRIRGGGGGVRVDRRRQTRDRDGKKDVRVDGAGGVPETLAQFVAFLPVLVARVVVVGVWVLVIVPAVVGRGGAGARGHAHASRRRRRGGARGKALRHPRAARLRARTRRDGPERRRHGALGQRQAARRALRVARVVDGAQGGVQARAGRRERGGGGGGGVRV
mmetsp:Transcript_12816/g.51491  ORF Transcript_12816/g.51491 Transcript_12816/m.51491 type:complete len:486 (+) Transcript_12816:1173-2630(+)